MLVTIPREQAEELARQNGFCHAELSDSQLRAARASFDVAGRFLHSSFEAWERGFLCDMNPDRELANWCLISEALTLYCETHNATPRRDLVIGLVSISICIEARGSLSKRVHEGLTKAYESTLVSNGLEASKRFPITIVEPAKTKWAMLHTTDIMERRARILASIHADQIAIGETWTFDGIEISAISCEEARKHRPETPDVDLVLMIQRQAA